MYLFSGSDFVRAIVLARTSPLEPEFCCLWLMAFSRWRLNTTVWLLHAQNFLRNSRSLIFYKLILLYLKEMCNDEIPGVTYQWTNYQILHSRSGQLEYPGTLYDSIIFSLQSSEIVVQKRVMVNIPQYKFFLCLHVEKSFLPW